MSEKVLVLIISTYSKGEDSPEIATTIIHDEEDALNALADALDGFGVEDEEIEQLVSLSLSRPGRTIEWGSCNSDGCAGVTLLRVS